MKRLAPLFALLVSSTSVLFCLACGERPSLRLPTEEGPAGFSAGSAPRAWALPRRLSATPFATARREVYEPRFALFTGGAQKVREVILPEGAALKSDGRGGWTAPEGTWLFKTFFLDGERVETRVAARVEGRWVMSAYAWAGDDAVRVDAPSGLDVGRAHHIPGPADCLTCHGHDDGDVVEPSPVAFAPYLLDHDGPGLTTSSLLASGRFRGKPPASLDQGLDEVAVAALGYLAVNCGTCHREGGAASFTPLRLDFDPATGAFHGLDAIGAAPAYAPPGGPQLLIAPGAPEESLVYTRMVAEGGSRMPLFAPGEHDTSGIQRVAGFIRSLDAPLEAESR